MVAAAAPILRAMEPAEPELLAALIRRQAVRTFDAERAVPPETIAAIVAAARWTGSARNRQPWRFVEVRRRDTIRALAALGAYAQFLAAAPVVLAVASADNGFADTEYDVGRVTQSLILAAAAHGLGCCPATVFPDANVDAAAQLLGLSAYWRPRHLLALGHPARADRSRAGGVSAVPRGRLEVGELLTRIEDDAV